MAEEEEKGAGTPPPASEEKPPVDQTAELDNLKKQITEKDERIGQAEYNIERLKQKLKDAGIESEEGSPEIAELRTLMGTLKEEISKLREEFSIKITEVGRAVTARVSASPGGDAGQEVPPRDEGTKEPVLSDVDKKLVLSSSLKWDPKRKGYVGKSGRFYPYVEGAGIETPITT